MNPLLGRLVAALQDYKSARISLDYLHGVLSSIPSALENDVPKSVRTAIREADDGLELVRFGSTETNRLTDSLVILLPLERVLDQFTQGAVDRQANPD